MLAMTGDRFAQSLIQSALDAIVGCDPHGRVVVFNGAAEQLFQRASADVIGQSMDILLPVRFRGRHNVWMVAFGDSPTVHRRMRGPGVIHALRADGTECPIEASISCIDENAERAYVVIMRDISERMALESERVQAEEQLLRLNLELDERSKELQRALDEAERANAAKSEFLTNISHELRTPLHGILGFASLSMDEEGLTPTLSRSLERISRNGKTLLTLVDDLLDSARINAGTFGVNSTRVDVIALVRQLVEDLTAVLDHAGVGVRMTLPDAAVVTGDPVRLAQAFRNVMANAVRFAPRDSQIDLMLVLGEDGCSLTISDSGPGVQEDERELIFEKFVQGASAKTGAGGAGLGLPIARAILRSHGGDIHVEHNEPQGARFVLRIPVPTVR